MKVKFKIKNACGEEKWWTPGENIRHNEWSLGDGDKVFLYDVVDDYRSLCRKEPLLTELFKIPTSALYVRLLIQYWEERGDEWLKAFIYAYQEIGNDVFFNATDLRMRSLGRASNSTAKTTTKVTRISANISLGSMGLPTA